MFFNNVSVLQAHYGTLLRLKQYFPFSLIDAMGSVEECRHQIIRELRYQSSMDLEEQTYSAIRHLPLARELVRTSRQQLVSHLDSYCRKHNSIFKQVRLQQHQLATEYEPKNQNSVSLSTGD